MSEKKSEIMKKLDHLEDKFQAGDKIKAAFNNKGKLTEYIGVIEKVTRTGLYRVKFEDCDIQYMRYSELRKCRK